MNTSFQAIYGPHHISDQVMEEISINVLNTPPSITNPGVLSVIRQEQSRTVVLEVPISDYDGILVARANLGVFTSFTSPDTWQTMYDDGTNGDAVAGDGVYSVEMQVRNSIPLGTHEILIQASDVFGKVSPTESLAVQLTEDDGILPSVKGSPISTGVLVGLLAICAIAGAAVIFVSIRNRPENQDGEDRFGFK
jgi:hypothetical protein